MRLMRYRPNRGVSGLHQEMDRFLENILPSSVTHDGIFAGHLAPPVDIYETGEELVIKAELPGVSREDVNISVEDGILTIQGERKKEEEIEEDNFHRLERSYGKFTRSFRLPKTVDADKTRAGFKEGVLRITLPRREEIKPREVKIELE